MLMQIAIKDGKTVHQMDFKSAYLNAEFDYEIFMNQPMDQPKGYTELGENSENLVFKLNKSLYILIQSGRNWNLMFKNCLLCRNFEQFLADCVLMKRVV